MPKQNGANGEHVVTMREVAKAAGVSIKTVSNVVNDYEFVSQATRDKVNKAIDELGYTLNVSRAQSAQGADRHHRPPPFPILQMPYFRAAFVVGHRRGQEAGPARDRRADANTRAKARLRRCTAPSRR